MSDKVRPKALIEGATCGDNRVEAWSVSLETHLGVADLAVLAFNISWDNYKKNRGPFMVEVPFPNIDAGGSACYMLEFEGSNIEDATVGVRCVDSSTFDLETAWATEGARLGQGVIRKLSKGDRI